MCMYCVSGFTPMTMLANEFYAGNNCSTKWILHMQKVKLMLGSKRKPFLYIVHYMFCHVHLFHRQSYPGHSLIYNCSGLQFFSFLRGCILMQIRAYCFLVLKLLVCAFREKKGDIVILF